MFGPKGVHFGHVLGGVSKSALKLKPFRTRGPPRNPGQSVTFEYRDSTEIGEKTENKRTIVGCQKEIFMKKTLKPCKIALASTQDTTIVMRCLLLLLYHTFHFTCFFSASPSSLAQIPTRNRLSIGSDNVSKNRL